MSSLFGQPANSLFGNNNNNQQQQNTSKSNLFGSFNTSTTSQPQQGGGLFGSTATSQPQQGGGLFGSTATSQPQQGGGLFGSTATPQPQQGGGLFGSFNTSAPASQEQQGGSLFSRITAPQPAGGGVFGSTQPQQQTGAFGSTQQQQQGGGLFGGLGATTNAQPQQQNQQQQGSSLFGNVGQPAPQQQQDQQPASVFVQSQGSFFQNENAPRKLRLQPSTVMYMLTQLFHRTKASTRANRTSFLEMEPSEPRHSLPNLPLQHCPAGAGAFLWALGAR